MVTQFRGCIKQLHCSTETGASGAGAHRNSSHWIEYEPSCKCDKPGKSIRRNSGEPSSRRCLLLPGPVSAASKATCMDGAQFPQRCTERSVLPARVSLPDNGKPALFRVGHE